MRLRFYVQAKHAWLQRLSIALEQAENDRENSEIPTRIIVRSPVHFVYPIFFYFILYK